MKILFLDMDGVMNSHTFLTAQERRREVKKTPLDMAGIEGWASMVDPKAVERLNRVIAATNARVVISSSGRRRGTKSGTAPARTTRWRRNPRRWASTG